MIVLTVPSDAATTWFDTSELLEQAGDRAKVYLVSHDGIVQLSQLLPEGTQVYGGAGRLYPPGTAWTANPFQAPLRTARSADDTPAATAGLVAELNRALSSPAGTSGSQVTMLREQVARLTSETDDLRATIATQHAQLVAAVTARDAARADLSRARQAMQAERKSSGETPPSQDWAGAFADPEEQFRFEVTLAWVRRIPAEQKADLPCSPYLLGPQFLDSIERVGGISRDKVVDVCVEVLTGLHRQQAARALHVLRNSAVGGSGALTRDDGAVAWRVSLQQDSASARRLHYWQLPDGGVELARVVTHDDTSI